MQRKELRENGPGVNQDYDIKTNIEMEGQFHLKLQNETAHMRKTLNEEISLLNMREEELREKDTTVEELQKTLDQEKREKMRLEEESVVVKDACRELEERLNKLLAQMRQVLDNKMLLWVEDKENRLREKELVLNELKKTIEEEKQARSRVEEELNQTKITCKEQEERLGTELKKMQRDLENEIGLRSTREKELREKKTFLDELQKELSEGKLAITTVEEESRQARNECIRLQRELENEREQMQRALEKEICLRRKTEQQLQKKETHLVALEKMLGDEQLTRTTLEKELTKERTDRIEERERMENEHKETERTLDIEKRLHETQKSLLKEKETVIDEIRERLSKAERTRMRMEGELSQERSSRNMLTERMENELKQIRERLDNEIAFRIKSEQKLSDKETIINEQRAVTEAQQRTFEEELNLRRDQIETKETALRDLRLLLEEERHQKTDLEERFRNLQLEVEEERDRRTSTERELNTATERQTRQTRDWIIQREEVVLSRSVLGKGAWGEVRKGTFRSCQVAVKKIHELILSDHNRRLFEREMTIASCCRHPNLLQFIGATNDDGSPLFVTELLDTNLRKVLSRRALNLEEIVSLALDVAKGLNYLHLNRPRPIIHRDISSGNVLLWGRDESWRAKLSDYGSANFMRQCMTENPGARIYSAPEAQTSQQSPKVRKKVYYII